MPKTTIDILSDVDFVQRAFAAGSKPEPDLTVSEWADANRKLSQKASAEPGDYRTARTPYLREIMDCLSPRSTVEEVVVMKSAQIGATEAGNNWVGFVVDHAPGPMLAVQPTTENAKRFSKMRLASMIQDCPTLRGKVRDPRSRDSGNTTLMKEFPGGVLVITGANSAVGLRSMPVRYLFLDEIDAYPGDLDNEGDPIELAVKRTATFRNRKIFKISTPTIKGASKIELAYLRGDQRGFYVPCPFCEHMQTLEFAGPDSDRVGGLKWPKGKPEEAAYECESCLDRFAEWHKTEILPLGEWRARSESSDPKLRTYHINSLYSPYGWPDAAWAALADKWEKESDDPIKLKTFYNLQLGLPFDDKLTAIVDAEGLMTRREVYDADVPEGVGVLTAGVDVQGNRLECEITGWGLEEESWSIAHFVIPGDTTKPETWAHLDNVLTAEYRNAQGIEFKIRATCVDTGFQTEVSTGFCAKRFARRVWAVRGRSDQPQVWPRRPAASKYHRTPLWNVGVSAAKDVIYARLAIQASGPGYCHFPIDRDKDYFDQLTAEVLVVNDRTNPPTRSWEKRVQGARNEALDIRVYAYAALAGLKAAGLDLNREAMAVSKRVYDRKKEFEADGRVRVTEQPRVVAAPPPPAPAVIRQQRFGRSQWMSR